MFLPKVILYKKHIDASDGKRFFVHK